MIFMKTNIRLLFTACAAALVTGCTNLDVDVESQYTEYPTNEIAVEAKMADVYYQMRDVFGRRYMEAQALSSDEYTAVSYGGGCLIFQSLQTMRVDTRQYDLCS